MEPPFVAGWDHQISCALDMPLLRSCCVSPVRSPAFAYRISIGEEAAGWDHLVAVVVALFVSRKNKHPRVVRLDQLHLPRPSQSPFCSSANFAIRRHSYIYLVFPRQGHLPSGSDQSKLVHEIDSKRHSREAECAGGSDLNTPLEQPVADQHTEAVLSDPHQRQWCPWVLADPAFEVPVLSFYQQYRPSREV